MNILMAIADSNSEYVDRLTEVLQQYEDLSIHIYTSGEKFQKAVDENGFLGIFMGGFTASAVGISAALVFGYLASLIFKPKMKK